MSTTDTIFGPQGSNATTTMPDGTTTNRYGSGEDTWAKDSATDAADGTILDAAFFNTIIGNLRTLVTEAIADGATDVILTDGQMDAVLEAVKFYAGGRVTAGQGLKLGTTGAMSFDFPSLDILTQATLNPLADTMSVYDVDFKAHKQITVGSAVAGSLKSGNGFITVFVAADGKATITLDGTSFIRPINTLPIATTVDPTLDLLAIWDDSTNAHAYLPIDNLPFATTGLTGAWVPAALPTTEDIGVTAYVVGMGGGGTANGLAVFDGTNWRRADDNQIVI
jgi:hypothetical protein